MSSTVQTDPVTILYTNWRGETAVRWIIPQGHTLGTNGFLGDALYFGACEPWHPEPQWLLAAVDMDKGEGRVFAVSGIQAWGAKAVAAMVTRDFSKTTHADMDAVERIRAALAVAVTLLEVDGEASTPGTDLYTFLNGEARAILASE